MKDLLKLTLPVIMLLTVLFSFKNADSKFIPTRLRVTVLDELGNLVDSAKVTLFKTEEDYRAETSPVGEPMYTSAKGVAKFTDLEPIPYFILAEWQTKANHGAGVKTQALEEGKINKVNTVIK